MNTDKEKQIDQITQKDLELKVEKFLDHSQFYLDRLSLLKNQLKDIKRLKQADPYIEKLSKSVIIRSLSENKQPS